MRPRLIRAVLEAVQDHVGSSPRSERGDQAGPIVLDELRAHAEPAWRRLARCPPRRRLDLARHLLVFEDVGSPPWRSPAQETPRLRTSSRSAAPPASRRRARGRSTNQAEDLHFEGTLHPGDAAAQLRLDSRRCRRDPAPSSSRRPSLGLHPSRRCAHERGLLEYVATDYDSVLRLRTRRSQFTSLEQMDNVLTVTAITESWDLGGLTPSGTRRTPPDRRSAPSLLERSRRRPASNTSLRRPLRARSTNGRT